MTQTLIGYARSTDAQDLTAQRDRLRELGVPEERTYLRCSQGKPRTRHGSWVGLIPVGQGRSAGDPRYRQ